MTYDDSGVRCTMLRGGTSRGLYFAAADLPTDPAERDDLLLRLMGSPDPRQIDGLGGATSLTSKVAVVAPSTSPDADVDYLFLQLGIADATVSDRQNCGNILAGVGPFAVERAMVPATSTQTSVRIRMLNSASSATATFPTPSGAVEYRGDAAIDGVPGQAAPVLLDFRGTAGSTTGALLPTGHLRETVDGVAVTCVDNGMPVVLALAESFGISGYEAPQDLAANTTLLRRVDSVRIEAAERMGLGDVRATSVPKTVLVAPARDGADVCTRSFIPVTPHAAVGVFAAISAVTAMSLPGTVAHHLAAGWSATSSRRVVEHPTGRLMLDVAVDVSAKPPAVLRSSVVSTARKLFDGTAYPRERSHPREATSAPTS